MKNFLKELVSVVPSKRQLDWYDVGFYAFVHFGVNTFTELEWGTGKESENIFNPTNLDCDQWVNAITTYLWLRYPDKYYIYKYSECRTVAREISFHAKENLLTMIFFLYSSQVTLSSAERKAINSSEYISGTESPSIITSRNGTASPPNFETK